MAPLTLFLGKLIGLFCVIFALAMLAHKESAIATLKSVLQSPPLLLIVEIIGLAAGLAMVLGHNVWSGGALPVVVTLLGWIMLVRGTALLALPSDAALKFFQAARYEQLFHLYMGGTLLLGLYLAYASFSA
jgi:hypothetical protein